MLRHGVHCVVCKKIVPLSHLRYIGDFYEIFYLYLFSFTYLLLFIYFFSCHFEYQHRVKGFIIDNKATDNCGGTFFNIRNFKRCSRQYARRCRTWLVAWEHCTMKLRSSCPAEIIALWEPFIFTVVCCVMFITFTWKVKIIVPIISWKIISQNHLKVTMKKNYLL